MAPHTRTAPSILLILMLSLSLLGATACGGQRIKPISIKNPVLTFESRQLLADTEDAVSIRRAARDDKARALDRARARRTDLVEQREWPQAASSALENLRTLEEQRVELAELDLAHAQAELDLARAKYDFTTAETAMRHDLAVYDLEPLRERVEKARTEVDEAYSNLADKRVSVSELETKWWNAYGTFVSKDGDSRVYYLSDASRQSVTLPEPPKDPDAAEGEQDDEAEDKAPSPADDDPTDGKVDLLEGDGE